MATPSEQLAKAQAAYHSLMIGESARVVVDQNGERVEFTTANAERLKAWIEELTLTVAGATRIARGPLRPYF